MSNHYSRLFLILLLLALAIWVDVVEVLRLPNPFKPGEMLIERDVAPLLGLDLRGGLQVVIEPDLPEDVPVDKEQLEVSRTIIENRTNALGVSENLIQLAGDRRIVAEFPGLTNTSSVPQTIQQTGLLEWVDFGTTPPPAGTVIVTDYGGAPSDLPEGTTVYHTIMTGAMMETVGVSTNQLNQPVVAFSLNAEGTRIFADYTRNNIGSHLGIVLDKRVISAPRVSVAITDGNAIIEGGFDVESANALAVQLRYGSLPIPLRIVETRLVGPTLGEDSLQKSLVAGLIGLVIVILFMALYYRLPGIAADISILIYAALAFAVFKLIHVTLTLPGIAGFLLSTGSALDANILIFERIKEELRNGLTLTYAVEKGWRRAWSSIRDSNIATLITCAILYWFGSAFGATIVKGFSVTLALGMFISLFTALFVTRTLLSVLLDWFKIKNFARWFGI
ncbi:MAG: protein translocase subunit SecD [Anaerolineales bacterium]